MHSTYLKEDVTLLLKDISGFVDPLPTSVREKMIQGGTHYSEMLPLEYKPSSRYMEIYNSALRQYGQLTACAVISVSEKIIALKGKSVVLVSLARAGTPIGILIKRYLKHKYKIDVHHYTISIIRGKGIDHNAMRHILKYHAATNLQFVDGWIGKGAILTELKKELQTYENVSPLLAVLADPAHMTNLCGTHEDFLIPSSCLNATVSGLISRTFLRKDIIGRHDFHGAAFYQDLASEDLSYDFIHAVETKMYTNTNTEFPIYTNNETGIQGLEEVEKIAREFKIEDINLVKPGIGETTRVLLRRVPWKILVNDKKETPYLAHIYQLAEEKGVEIVEYPLKCYRACGIIRKEAADA